MKIIYLLTALLIVSACNLVQLKENHSTKKLNRNSIAMNYFDADSLHVKYWKGGSGPVVVFIHGFGGDALLTWEKELHEFSKTHTVIAMDLLWFGESKWNKTPNLATQTQAIEALLTHLNITRAKFIGQSYGGFVAIDFAIKNQAMVEKLCIANCPGTTFNVAELETVCKSFGVSRVDELFVFDDPLELQRLLNLSTYSNKKLPKSVLKQAYAEYFSQNHVQLRQLMQSLPGEQARLTDVRPLQRIPTLVLWGEKDEIFSYAEGEKFAKTIQAQFISIPNSGHAVQVDQHKAFTNVLGEFIRN